jgi:hemoglobin
MKIQALIAAGLLITSPALAASVWASPAWAEAPKPANAPVVSPDGSLFKAFGGHDGLVRVVDDLFVNVDSDDRIKGFFQASKRAHTKAMLVEQFCQITGGGCVYSGQDMAASHRELGITKADFDALVEDLQKAMTRNNVSFSAQNRLLAALAPQNRAIVYHPTAADAATSGPVKP